MLGRHRQTPLVTDAGGVVEQSLPVQQRTAQISDVLPHVRTRGQRRMRVSGSELRTPSATNRASLWLATPLVVSLIRNANNGPRSSRSRNSFRSRIRARAWFRSASPKKRCIATRMNVAPTSSAFTSRRSLSAVAPTIFDAQFEISEFDPRTAHRIARTGKTLATVTASPRSTAQRSTARRLSCSASRSAIRRS